MPVTLLVPGLLDVDAAALAADAVLATVAAQARGIAVDDAESELMRVLGHAPHAAASLAALGAGVEVDGDWIARADPVATLVTHEDVRIVARVDDLGVQEVQALRELLDGHFRDDGLAFVAPRRDAWFVRSATPQALEALPLAAVVGRPLRERLPRGPDAARWRRWWTEVQMLLHGHPVAQREPAPVHALWFASGSTLPEASAATACFASDSRDGDVVRGLARARSAIARLPDAVAGALVEGAASVAVVADPVALPDDVTAFAARRLQPLLDALRRGAIDRLELIAGGRRGAARWSLHRPGLVARLFPRRAPFVVPPAEGGE